jgi:hypothetical protein
VNIYERQLVLTLDTVKSNGGITESDLVKKLEQNGKYTIFARKIEEVIEENIKFKRLNLINGGLYITDEGLKSIAFYGK